MSKKNSLENKALRRAQRTKDRGYPNYYVQVSNIETGEIKTVPYHKAETMTKDVHLMNWLVPIFSLYGVASKLGLDIEQPKLSHSAKWVLYADTDAV